MMMSGIIVKSLSFALALIVSSIDGRPASGPFNNLAQGQSAMGSTGPGYASVYSDIKVDELSESDIEKYLDTESLLQPVWVPCPQTSKTSYLNVSFSPYPLPKGRNITATLKGYVEEPLTPGTRLRLFGSNVEIPIIPLPQITLDVCSFIEGQFVNATQPVKCPIAAWASLLVFNAIKNKQISQMDSDAAELASSNRNQLIGLNATIPRLQKSGRYSTYLQLIDGQKNVLTCAHTILRIK
ncbi:hypothetical protein MP228_002466 [Amoeboaphelidium protococcarum]|nr:hypothetical protein MP228_002466 [Amoeboaphelidium protococcarum]